MKKANWLKLKIKVSRKTYNRIKKTEKFIKKNKKNLLIAWVVAVWALLLLWKSSNPVLSEIDNMNKQKNLVETLSIQKQQIVSKLKKIESKQAKLEQNISTKENVIINKIANLRNIKYKKEGFKKLLWFIPNKYLLTHTYYKAPVAKVKLIAGQYKLNWRVNSNGAGKSYIGLQWTTKQERIKSLLSYYNLWNSYNVWTKVAKKYNLKPEILVCIAWADTDLWKQLKSRNNIGNVGNNDRGNVVHYNSLKKGISAIGRVLNNRYLGGLNTVGELSEGGRKILWLPSCKERGVYCYATSKENWNVNVINCLSMINNKPVNEKYNIRVRKDINTNEIALMR